MIMRPLPSSGPAPAVTPPVTDLSEPPLRQVSTALSPAFRLVLTLVYKGSDCALERLAEDGSHHGPGTASQGKRSLCSVRS